MWTSPCNWDGRGEVAHFNAYNRPKPEVEKYGSMLAVCWWVPYERIGGITCPSLPNGNVGLGWFEYNFSTFQEHKQRGFKLVMEAFWATLKEIQQQEQRQVNG